MKKVLISTFILIFIISMVTVVNAATGSISLSASSDTVLKGKTFTVTVAGTADNNITGMEAKFSYDTTKLSIESKAVGSGFSDLSGENEIAIASTGSDNLSKAGTLYTITFKVLDTATEGDTTISVTNAVLALVNDQAVQENTEESNDEVTITIKADDTTIDNENKIDDNSTTESDNTNTTNKTNTASNSTKNNSSTSSYNKSTSTSNSSSKATKLPQTGVGTAGIIAIIALSVVSIASYISYRKYKNI